MGVKIADDWTGDPDSQGPNLATRRIILTPASTIKPKRVRWLWDQRIPYGTLALLAGREGLGKSTLAYQLAADITRGQLDGEDKGNPRPILVCATEDSWDHTIVPRLIAARADLDLVYKVEMVRVFDEMRMTLSLPSDFGETRAAAEETGAGLMILDPLMSVIDSKLNTHHDREVRQALEPLKELAEAARMAILGLIHHNKSGSTDALQLVMGSKAFSAVARSVHTVIPDPDDDTQTQRLFATSKNNLGRLDLPVLGFTITGHPVETEDDGTAWTGRLNWTGEIDGSMHEIMTRSADPERGATADAAQWLEDYLSTIGGECAKVDLEKAGRVAGHAPRTLQRARERLGLTVSSFGFPRRTFWAIPGSQVETTDHTEPVHEAPLMDGTTGAEVGTTGADVRGDASGANYTPEPDLFDSRAKSRQPVAPLGTTGPDLRKQDSETGPALAGARAQGEPLLGTTGDLAQLQPPVAPSNAVVPRPRTHAPARDPAPPQPPAVLVPDLDVPAPLCDDCGYPIDTTQHTTTCEEAP